MESIAIVSPCRAALSEGVGINLGHVLTSGEVGVVALGPAGLRPQAVERSERISEAQLDHTAPTCQTQEPSKPRRQTSHNQPSSTRKPLPFRQCF